MRRPAEGSPASNRRGEAEALAGKSAPPENGRQGDVGAGELFGASGLLSLNGDGIVRNNGAVCMSARNGSSAAWRNVMASFENRQLSTGNGRRPRDSVNAIAHRHRKRSAQCQEAGRGVSRHRAFCNVRMASRIKRMRWLLRCATTSADIDMYLIITRVITRAMQPACRRAAQNGN